MKTLRMLSILVALLSIGQLAQAQSLPEIARQERERQKNPPSKSLVITGPTIITDAGTTATTNATTSATADATRPAAPTGPTDNKGRDEKYWRGTFEKARADLKRAEDSLKLLDLKMNDLSSQLLRESVYANEVTLRSEIEKTKGAQEVARSSVAAGLQKIRDLEEELRRSGGLPGWAR
jgi:hypothetical protein